MALAVGAVESVQLYSGVHSQVVEMEQSTGAVAGTWYDGDLILTSGGLVSGVMTTGVINGIALADSTTVDYAALNVALIDPGEIYVMRMEDGKYSTRAYVGNKYGLNNTAGQQRINQDETSSVDVYIVGIHPSDKHADGSTGLDEGRVLVRFNYDIFIGV